MREAPLVALVEDDPIMGESLAMGLDLEGFDVRWLQTGAAALSEIARLRPDAVLCDIRLGDVDGATVFHRLRDQGATHPVIFMTAFGDVEQAVALIRAGARDYITKPFDLADLIRRLREALTPPSGPVAPLVEAREAAEQAEIEKALAATQGHVGEAARLLKVSRTTLWEKMRRYAIRAED